MHVDSSDSGVGACLFLEEHFIGFASRSLTSTVQKYAIIEKELLVVHSGAKKFDYFLSDHKPLVKILNKDINYLSPLIQCIRLKLLNYEFDVHNIPGREMIIPKASRLQL